MKTFAKTLTALSLATTLALTTACGGSAPAPTAPAPAPAPAAPAAPAAEKVKLTFSHYFTKEEEETSNESKVFRTMLKEYMEANPNVEISTVEMNNNDYQTKLPAQAAGDDLPDVFCTLGSWITNFADSNMMADLTPALNASSYMNNYRETIFDPVTVDGKIYGTPLQFSASGYVFYNAKLWKEAGFDTFPATWEEVFAAKDKFDKMGVATMAHANKEKWNYESCWLSTIGDRFTGTDWTKSIIARDGKAKFTDPDFVASLDFTQKIAQSGILNPDFNALSTAQGQQLFAEGKAATLIDGYWALPYLQQNVPADKLSDMKVALIPNTGTPKGPKNSLSGGGGWYLSVNSKLEGAAKDEAIKLALYLTGPEFSKRYAEQFGGIGPVKTDAADLSKFDSLTQEYIKVTEQAVVVPIYDAQMDAGVCDIMNNGLQELLGGTKTAKALADEIQAAQDQLP
ncbi:MAG: extracellular solute-binding protein [Angelakisella sp.]